MSSNKSGLKIVKIFADSAAEWNCSQWRDLGPSDAFNRAGGKWSGKLLHASGFLNYLSPVVQNYVMQADLITVQRNVIDPQILESIKYFMGLGKPVAIDLDDAYHILPWSNPAHQFWVERDDIYANSTPGYSQFGPAQTNGHGKVNGAALRYLEDGLRLTQALIAPNRNLLNDWGHVCRGYYLQNYAESGWWVNLPTREEVKKEKGLEGKIVIGWGGSVSHYDSWYGSGIFEAAGRICRRHSNVVWLICGNDGRIHKDLPVPYDQKASQPGVPAQDWPRSVRGFDIGVAPLWGIYDQRRSWIKGMEYSLAGVPWAGTSGEVYRDLADTGTLVPNGADAWELAIERLIGNLEREQQAMEARIPEAQGRFLVDNNLDKFERVYRQVITDFQTMGVGVLPGVVKL